MELGRYTLHILQTTKLYTLKGYVNYISAKLQFLCLFLSIYEPLGEKGLELKAMIETQVGGCVVIWGLGISGNPGREAPRKFGTRKSHGKWYELRISLSFILSQ